ncbi:hypothetical protein M8C21_024420 [Ambrosia artemisiifolia]|uniref:RRM domain-containing protein n=1 Tax=Ambrosia artemisiifolia TaxID=4212 RepID=A0AAD5CFW8_AMBAR|nr:hypothetical protein M8C21_024420 [Ambrosia artemisiifolia]
MTKRALKASGQTDLSGNASKDLMLMRRLGESIFPMKEDFIMVHLQHAYTNCCILMVSGQSESYVAAERHLQTYNANVTDYILQETFRAHYPSVKSAKVVTDRMTGRTKGYGFVKFGDETEQLRAMTEMNGRLCSIRPMRIGPAANKTTVSRQQYPKGCNDKRYTRKGNRVDLKDYLKDAYTHPVFKGGEVALIDIDEEVDEHHLVATKVEETPGAKQDH